MKKQYIFLLLVTSLLNACSKEEIKTYYDLTNNQYISFNYRGELSVSFYNYPGKDTICFGIPVTYIGFKGEKKQYEVGVLVEQTTAPENSYDFTTIHTFRDTAIIYENRNVILDTFYININKVPILESEEVCLALQLKENDDFKLGNTSTIKILISNILSQPTWWNRASAYLGNYSDKKYLLYLDVVKVDLTDATTSEIKHYALQFKRYLEEQNALGNTVYEENGAEMTVPVQGSF